MISKVFKDPPRTSDPALASVSGSVLETGELHFLKLEAENMALSLEAAGYGRPGGKMCTPLERYRAKYPRQAQNAEITDAGPVSNDETQRDTRRSRASNG